MRSAENVVQVVRRLRLRQCHPQHPSDPWHCDAADGTYGVDVAISRDLARVNFGKWVIRVLASARRRGLSDAQIKDATGVGPSTFHRWRRGDWGSGKGWPQLDAVIAFAEGLGEAPEDAFDALGVSGRRVSSDPDAPIDPDIWRLNQRLNSTRVPAPEKSVIREMLAFLIQRPLPELDEDQADDNTPQAI